MFGRLITSHRNSQMRNSTLQAGEFEIWRLQLLRQLLSSEVTMHQVLSIVKKSLLQCWNFSICHVPLGCVVNCTQVSPRHFEKHDFQDLEKIGLDQTEHLEFPSNRHQRFSCWLRVGSWLVQRAFLAMESDWPLMSEWCSCAYANWRSNMVCNLSHTRSFASFSSTEEELCNLLCVRIWDKREWRCVCAVAQCGRRTRNFSITRSNNCVRSPSCQKSRNHHHLNFTQWLRRWDKNACQCAVHESAE